MKNCESKQLCFSGTEAQSVIYITEAFMPAYHNKIRQLHSYREGLKIMTLGCNQGMKYGSNI